MEKLEYSFNKYRKRNYKATKINKNFLSYNFIGETGFGEDKYNRNTIMFCLNYKLDTKTLQELSDYINALLSCRVEYNKDIQLEQLIKQHYTDIGMTEKLSNTLKETICNKINNIKEEDYE